MIFISTVVEEGKALLGLQEWSDEENEMEEEFSEHGRG